MKKTILGLVASVAVAFGWNVEQVANMQFCYHARVDFSACSFADTFMNEMYPLLRMFERERHLEKNGKMEIDKKELAELKKDIEREKKRFNKTGLRKLCARWEITSYAGRQFIENQVTMMLDGEARPIVSSEDIRNLCDN